MNAQLVVIGKRKGGKEIPISSPMFVIGRAEDCQFRIVSDRIDPRHCVISMDGETLTIEDCGGDVGTVVNDERISEQRQLHNGDRIALGTLVLEVRIDHNVGGGSQPDESDSEASILHWLEDGEEIDDEERYWRRAISQGNQALRNDDADGSQRNAQSQRGGPGAFGGGAGGSGGSLFDKDESKEEARKVEKPKTRLQKILIFLADVLMVGVGFLKSLNTIDWILVGIIIVILIVVLVTLFPVTLLWLKAVVLVHKWPFWIWTCIFVMILCVSVVLRSRYE
jgi:hypothetical protein